MESIAAFALARHPEKAHYMREPMERRTVAYICIESLQAFQQRKRGSEPPLSANQRERERRKMLLEDVIDRVSWECLHVPTDLADLLHVVLYALCIERQELDTASRIPDVVERWEHVLTEQGIARAIAVLDMEF